ncbi:MAG: hypothetical protein JNM88_11930 [Chitinophagaceae bacterium]|nr:hypothetical protein [Chitinophagaceae bacterium]
MNKTSLILFIVLFAGLKPAQAQRNYLQVFAIGIPFQSGAGIGNIGFERINKNQTGAWQANFHIGGGTLATDIGTPLRIWVSGDKLFSLNKKTPWIKATVFSVFIETGSRTRKGADLTPENGQLLNTEKAVELCPGIAIGQHLKLGKRSHLQLLAGPKLIAAFHADEYFETASGNRYVQRSSSIRGGYRILINFCFPLGK